MLCPLGVTVFDPEVCFAESAGSDSIVTTAQPAAYHEVMGEGAPNAPHISTIAVPTEFRPKIKDILHEAIERLTKYKLSVICREFIWSTTLLPPNIII